jgi:glutamyl/glutaminyl-tRNA synthetase
LTLCQGKARSLDELPEFCRYFFSDEFALDEKTGNKIAKKADPKELLGEIVPVLEATDFDADALQAALEAHAESKDVKVFAYFPALRYALSGKGGGPDLMPMLVVLGKERVLARLKAFIA